ncbi:MAG: hypothetical protein GY849_01500 [Deltaproteobacteria bacterium]|nr:hypothetical protein [Deltaproteobacteria bacterium]
MDPISWIMKGIDSFLIAPYRWPGDPVVGWWLGTLLIAMWCTLLGEMTLALAYRANRRRMEAVSQEMVERHNQSLNALKSGNKPAYKAINRLANEAFGRSFFLQMAFACSSLWPVPFALGWMQTRFSDVDFPLLIDDMTVGYAFVFIPLYVLVRIFFNKIKSRIPFGRNT